MEIEFDERKGSSTPKTRIVSQKGAKAQAAGNAPGRNADARIEYIDDEGYRIRETKEKLSPFSRIALIFCGFVFSGMLLFTLSGYERIARAHADINLLNEEIDVTELRILALDVAIECAVTIQDAQAAANTYGMQYPTQDQYVRIGDSLPISGSAPTVSSAIPAGSAPTDAPNNG